jgi:hypothetical protein
VELLSEEEQESQQEYCWPLVTYSMTKKWNKVGTACRAVCSPGSERQTISRFVGWAFSSDWRLTQPTQRRDLGVVRSGNGEAYW